MTSRPHTTVEVDLMVQEPWAGSGSRAARLEGDAKNVARNPRGLEAALIDKQTAVIAALDASDTRSFSVTAAGTSVSGKSLGRLVRAP